MNSIFYQGLLTDPLMFASENLPHPHVSVLPPSLFSQKHQHLCQSSQCYQLFTKVPQLAGQQAGDASSEHPSLMEIQLAREVSTNSNRLQEMQLAGHKGTKILCTPLHQKHRSLQDFVFLFIILNPACLNRTIFKAYINLDMNRAL